MLTFKMNLCLAKYTFTYLNEIGEKKICQEHPMMCKERKKKKNNFLTYAWMTEAITILPTSLS